MTSVARLKMHQVQLNASVVYSLSSSHSGPSVLRASYAFARGKPPGPWPPAATLGDVQLSQTLKGLSAREREVSPTPFIPTRRVVVRHSPCTPWQPFRLGPKMGLTSLDTPRQGPLAVCPCTLSGVSDGQSAIVGIGPRTKPLRGIGTFG